MSLYDKYVLPKFLNCACGSNPVSRQRQKVVPLVEGKVLEVGVGSGLNLPFYDKSKIDELWGLDPSEELRDMARKVADRENIVVNFVSSGAEEIPLPDSYFDSVLITYTMCTIPEVARANKEIKRVLKRGGKLIFCEHGEAPDENIRKSSYVISKDNFSEYLNEFAKKKDINLIEIYLSNTFGLGDKRKKLIPNMIESIKSGEEFVINNPSWGIYFMVGFIVFIFFYPP